jgi:hypothetical protein
MNIHTVAENLRKTIAGKENMLLAVQQERTFVGLRDGEDIALKTTAQFLQINIGELKRILEDVEQCVKQASDHSWMINQDRMGGGGYSADELDPNRGWK